MTETITGVLIDCKGTDPVQAVQAWLDGISETSVAAGFDVTADNYTLLQVSMPCGITVRFPDAECVPTHSVLCPCGDPSHWLIQVVNGKVDDKREGK